MSINKDKKQELIGNFKIHDKDTGSSMVQIAILTERIKNLTDHLKIHQKDFSSRRGLLILVSKRRSLLTYLKNTNFSEYEAMLNKLNLRGVK
ncbi:30S ribosomal protein S15 [Rickettsiales bacterium LUAb2]